MESLEVDFFSLSKGPSFIPFDVTVTLHIVILKCLSGSKHILLKQVCLHSSWEKDGKPRGRGINQSQI